jgi:hypothetical protein
MWQRAIKELQRMDGMITISQKLRYLLSALILVNNSFSLFGDVKENMAATADDLLSIFPYILLKSRSYNIL